MSTLIVSEKNNTAKKIADILSGKKGKSDKTYNIPVYRFKTDGKEYTAIGLKGHILKVDFEERYNNWQKTDPVELIDARIIKDPVQKNIVKALKKEAKEADEIIIATDFDREGELIGVDALNEIKQAKKKDFISKRARFSALTPAEINKSFSELEEIYWDLAEAGETRQDIDLIWGAVLTRFISLATTRLGRQFLSAGRVQTPSLALIIGREKERQAFKSEPFWVLTADFEKDNQNIKTLHKTEKFFNEEEANNAKKNMAKTGEVTKVAVKQTKTNPPAPFNTTAFLSAAASIGISPARAMRLAESLYMSGYTSYPRVDNTVYPESLDFRGTLKEISKVSEFSSLAKELLGKSELKPTRGKKQATDHPPIHPTGHASQSDLDPAAWKIYELICRRFMATLSDVSLSESTRADIKCGTEDFFVRGRVIVNEGWLKFYTYSRKKDEEVPKLNEGDVLDLVSSNLERKETTPPPRYSQAKLVTLMEENGLGTKSTRHSIIQSLYDRGYIHSDPIEPTETGIAVIKALEKYADKITTPDLTVELEQNMDEIANGKNSRKNVLDESRKMLTQVMLSLKSKEKEFSEEVRQGIRFDKVISKCPECDGNLVIKRSRYKKRFVGCSNYRDKNCTVAYPLPTYGEIISLGEVCEVCGAPKIKVINKGRRPWITCINLDCVTNKKTDKPATAENVKSVESTGSNKTQEPETK
jgi:DNA topoisomerase-1